MNGRVALRKMLARLPSACNARYDTFVRGGGEPASSRRGGTLSALIPASCGRAEPACGPYASRPSSGGRSRSPRSSPRRPSPARPRCWARSRSSRSLRIRPVRRHSSRSSRYRPRGAAPGSTAASPAGQATRQPVRVREGWPLSLCTARGFFPRGLLGGEPS